MLGSGLKDRKALVTCIAIIVLAAIALVLIFSGGERKDEGPVVLASKRVKLTAEERKGAVVKSTPKTPEKATKKVAKPAPPKKKPAPRKKAAEKKPVAKKKAVAPKKPAPKKTVAKPTPKKKVVVKKKAASTSRLSATLPWAINLASFSKPSAASALVVKLKASGYNAYTTKFVKDGKNWNRVRVGFFKSREDALKSADMLSKRKLVRSKPWVVKPQTDEIIKYSR